MRKFHFKFDCIKSNGGDTILSQVVIEKFGCRVVDTIGNFWDGEEKKEMVGGTRYVEVVNKDTTAMDLQFLQKVLTLTMGQEITFEFDE